MKSRRLGAWLFYVAAWSVALAFAGRTQATPVAYDDLESATPGGVDGQTSGTGFAAGYVLGGGAVCFVTNRSLSYSNGDIQRDGGTNVMAITTTNVSAVAFTRALGSLDGDDLYLSFLFETPTADGGANEDFLSVGFNNAVGETTAGVEHRFSSPAGDHAFGIRYGSSDAKGSIGTEINRTYFVVLRLRKLTPGASQVYNELALFVNPSTRYEPVPTMVVTNARWSAATYLAVRIANSEAGDTYYLDNLCIGTTYDSAVWPLGDGPVTAAPAIAPRTGTLLGKTTVSITCPTAGAEILYTLDGSDPSPAWGTVYTGPFDLTASATVRAVAYSEGKQDSAIASVAYVLQTHWVGGAGNLNWSATGNWDPAVSPAGADVVFDSSNTVYSTKTPAMTVTNSIVDEDVALGSLSYVQLGGSYWHLTHIGEGVTLTLDGRTSAQNVFFLGKTETQSGQTYTYTRMFGGGAFVVDAPHRDFLITKTSNNDLGTALLDASNLSRFSASVSNFWVGLGSRTASTLRLPVFGEGSNTITAVVMAVGDGNGAGETSGTSLLSLGLVNLLSADDIFIGATAYGANNVQSGRMSFPSGLSGAALCMRGRAGGASRANLTVGSHGKTATARQMSASVDWSEGTVDARIGTLILGDGRGTYSTGGGKGTAWGTLAMGRGCVDAQSVVIGRTLNGGGSSGSANTAGGTCVVSNGVFVAESVSMADNNSGSSQNVSGSLTVAGTGTVVIANGLAMGTANGTATGIVASVTLSGGSLTVLGTMEPGNDSSNIVSVVALSGGTLAVTNAAGDAALRIERGTLSLSAGSASLDRLVMTNALSLTQVELRGTGSGDYGRVAVNAEVRLGGALSVTASGYTPKGGDSWSVVGGSGTRTGTFSSATVPEGLKVVYTVSGFDLVCPMAGTIVLVQ